VSRLLATAIAAVLGAGALVPRVAPPVAPAASVFSEGIPMRSPTAVGMSAERLAAIDRVVLTASTRAASRAPPWWWGATATPWSSAATAGLTWDAAAAPASEQTIYDLASLTKVVATTSAIMALVDDGQARPRRAGAELPSRPSRAAPRTASPCATCSRTGRGSPPGATCGARRRRPRGARQVLESRLYCEPGACYEYSDLGADVLGIVAETVGGQRLDRLVQERVFGPLGMGDTYFRPPTELRARIAPTEVAPPRGYPLRGEVHDENAYALGGIAGHAGLFSTAADLSIFAQTLLNGGSYRGVRVFSESTVRLFTRRAAGTRALGWDTCDKNSACGELMGESAFGHTGFTGTSLWLDPEQRMFVLLLTNRVHNARAARPARVIADVRADLSDAAQLAVLDDPRGVAEMPEAFRADEGAGWNPVVRERPRRYEASARGEARIASARRAKSKPEAASARAASNRRAGSKAGKKGAAVKAKPGAAAKGGRSVAPAGSAKSTKSGAKASGAKAAATKSASAKKAPTKKAPTKTASASSTAKKRARG
jgi:CubicO group peptidase (beta-lactamase class C family)